MVGQTVKQLLFLDGKQSTLMVNIRHWDFEPDNLWPYSDYITIPELQVAMTQLVPSLTLPKPSQLTGAEYWKEFVCHQMPENKEKHVKQQPTGKG